MKIVIVEGKVRFKKRKRKALRFGTEGQEAHQKGLKGESLALNPDVPEVQPTVQRNNIGEFTRA